MQTAAALYLWILSGGIVLLILTQAMRRTHGILTLRNLFLLGFILFQLHSAALSLYWNEFGAYRLMNPTQAGVKFALMASVFLMIFLLVYERGLIASRLATWVPRSQYIPPPTILLMLSFVFLLLGMMFRYAMPSELLIKLGQLIGVGFVAIACALAGWVWAPRLLNPVIAATSTFIVLASALTSLSTSFGRRPLVAVAGALLWGMYYSHWRYLPLKSQIWRFAVASVVPLLLLAAVTNLRSASDKRKGMALRDQLSDLRGGVDYRQGFANLADGQLTGACAMWVIENFPNAEPYQHMLTLRLVFLRNIPRSIWPTKPDPLSQQIPRMARIWGTNWDGHTRPAGMIGSAAAEGGWYALVIYAIFFAVILRFFDEIVRLNPTNAFLVVAIGSALGQILGLARGEVAAFANIFLLCVIATWFGLIIVGKLIDQLVARTPHPTIVHTG